MNSFEAYVQYVSIKNHFNNPNFNYFKYAGKTRITVKSFENRKDQYWFTSLSKKGDVKGFLVSNFIEDKDFWIGRVNKDETEKIFTDWKRRTQSLTYYFEQDIKKLDMTKFMWYFVSDDVPPIIQMYIRREISHETFVCLFHILKCHTIWSSNSLTIVQDAIQFAQKYYPFLKVDEAKLRNILKKHLNSTK